MACRDMDILWKEYSSGPSQSWDNQSSKRAPEFSIRERQRQTRGSVRSESWVHDNLGRSGVKDKDFCLQKPGGDDDVLKVLHELEEFEDSAALVNLIKVCGNQKNLRKGCKIHADLLKIGLLDKDIYAGTALLRMYAKCGALGKAQEVFDNLPARDVASWNALIAGYVEHGLGNEALNCFGQMRDEGHSPNAITFVCISKACSSIGAAEKGKEIHAEVRRQGLLGKNILLGTALVDMYARCGALAKAQEVLDELSEQNVVSWNALICGYAQHGLGDEALECFQRMQNRGLTPDSITFVCMLKACSSIGAVEKGEELHAKLSRQGLLEKDIVLGTALVDMYAKCGVLAKAQQVFDGLRVRNLVSWNVLIAGYAQHGLGDEALNCFGRMQNEGLSPNAVTFVCILKACGSIGAVKKGEEIHVEVRRQGLLEENIVVGSALVDMYAKCGALAKAQEVFDELPARNAVIWNVLIAGYAHHGLGDEALCCFQRMREEGHSPDAITFVCILQACSSIGAVGKGQGIHVEVGRQRLLEKDFVLGTALVDMYGNCGVLMKAQEVFDELPARDVASWNALMAGYSQLGKDRAVFDLFSKMIGECIEPNLVTFVVLLNVCNHAGLVGVGQMYFNTMIIFYGLTPTLEHLTCMVDLFSRAGQFEEALGMIEKVPPSDRLLLLSALSGACRNMLNVELGRWAFEHAVQLDEKYDAAYVCMGNIYAAAGMQEEADNVGAWKVPGCSR